MTTTDRLALELVRTGHCHSLSSSHNPRVILDREEFYPSVELTYRGTRYRVDLRADRYVANVYDASTDTSTEEWGAWRCVSVHGGTKNADTGVLANLTPGLAAVIREHATPLVARWIDSDDYRASRGRAIANAIRRYTIDGDWRAESILKENGHELDPRDRDYLEELADAYAHARLLAARELPSTAA